MRVASGLPATDAERYLARNSLKQSLLTVNISGVTIDGDGVYADAGVVYRDAQGTITRSRITNVVTTETSYDVPRPGEYKGSNDGIAIAPPHTGSCCKALDCGEEVLVADIENDRRWSPLWRDLNLSHGLRAPRIPR